MLSVCRSGSRRARQRFVACSPLIFRLTFLYKSKHFPKARDIGPSHPLEYDHLGADNYDSCAAHAFKREMLIFLMAAGRCICNNERLISGLVKVESCLLDADMRLGPANQNLLSLGLGNSSAAIRLGETREVDLLHNAFGREHVHEHLARSPNAARIVLGDQNRTAHSLSRANQERSPRQRDLTAT